VDLEKIREAGLRTAIVKAVPIEGKVIDDVFNGHFFTTSISTDNGLIVEKMHLALVHEYEGVIRSYDIPTELSNRSSVLGFIKSEFTLGLEDNDPQAKKLLQALRLVFQINNIFPHYVKRNGADIWTLVVGQKDGGKYEGFRVRIDGEMKPVDIKYDREISKEDLE